MSIKKEGDMVVQLMWDENHLMIIDLDDRIYVSRLTHFNLVVSVRAFSQWNETLLIF